MKLFIWSLPEMLGDLDWAMTSLKQAMEWDEKVYGKVSHARTLYPPSPVNPPLH